MNAKEAIREASRISQLVLDSYFSDLSDAELLHRPGPGCNHLAWQLGHLISSEAALVNMVRPAAAAELPAGFSEKHDKTKINVDDPKQFCTKQEYLELAKRVREASMKLLEELPDAELDAPGPERMKGLCPTVGSLFLLIATHPMMHAGQFVPVRRSLGKPVLI